MVNKAHNYGTKMAKIIAVSFYLLLLLPLGVNCMPSADDSNRVDPIQIHTTTSSNYPYSDWLSLWQMPNGSEADSEYGTPKYNEFPGEDVITPTIAADYWGTDTFLVYNPDSVYIWSNWTYTWDELADPSIFPPTSTLIIQITPSSIGKIRNISFHAVNDSRIVGGWWDEFPCGDTSATVLKSVHDNLTCADSELKLYLGVRSSIDYGYKAWYLASSKAGYSWSELAPYFDVIMFSHWQREYPYLPNHLTGWTDDVRDFADMVPGKEFIFNVFIWHYTIGAFPWDYYAELLSQSAKLFYEGTFTGVSVLTTFWQQWNPLTSNYLRAILATEFANDWQTTINLQTSTISSTLNGETSDPVATDLTLKWTGNWTFESRHTQTIHFADCGLNDLTVKNLMTGDLECLGGLTFVAAAGQKYQVYNWPHSTTHYAPPHPNIYINTTTAFNDKLLIVEGSIFINASLYLNRTVVQFGHQRYNNYVDNFTLPTHGIYVPSDSSNFTIALQNSTIEPLLRTFPYRLVLSSVPYGASRTLAICNSTIATYAHTLSFRGASWWMADSICYDPKSLGTAECGVKVYTPSALGIAYLYRNTIVAENILQPGYATLGLWTDLGDSGSVIQNNTVVGGSLGLYTAMQYNLGSHTYDNMMVYRKDYNQTADNHGEYLYPEPYNEDREAATWWTYDIASWYGSWTSRQIYVTTKFKIETEIPLSGTLTDYVGSPIGAYSSSGGLIVDYDIPLLTNNNGAVFWNHPFPWKFTITSELPAGYWYAVRSYGSYAVNTTGMLDPWLKPVEDGYFWIEAEDAWNIEFVQTSMQIYEGLTMTIHPSKMIDATTSLYPWSNLEYLGLPTQIPLSVSGIQSVTLRITDYSASSKLISWTSVTDNVITYTPTGLDSRVGYKVYQDGEEIFRSHSGYSSFSFTAVGGGEFEVKVWDPYQIWEDAGMMVLYAGIAIGLAAVILSAIFSRVRR